MDPFDILELEVAPMRKLPHHAEENERVVALLKESNLVPRYIRHNWIERFNDLKLVREAVEHAIIIEGAQKVRLSVTDSLSDEDAAVAPESGSEEPFVDSSASSRED